MTSDTRGAVLSQLPNEALVTSVVAARHYGVWAHQQYEDEDAGQKTWYDASHGHLRINKACTTSSFDQHSPNLEPQMTWYIEKGEDLQRDQKIRFPFHRRLAPDHTPDDLIFTQALHTDESTRAHKYPDESFVKQNCTLSADLRSIDESLLRNRVGVDGKPYVEVKFDLVISLKSALMKFSLEIKGKEYGSVAAKYE